jgi:hypothetical protein
MVKAEDLIKKQKDKQKLKKKTYKKVFDRIEKKIILASNSNSYNCAYEIPKLIIGLPIYSVEGCTKYVIKKLKKNGFQVELLSDSNIFISWYPKEEKS